MILGALRAELGTPLVVRSARLSGLGAPITCDCLGPIACIQLTEDALKMDFHGPLGDAEAIRGLMPVMTEAGASTRCRFRAGAEMRRAILE